MWNCGNNDIEFVTIAELVCDYDCFCECLAKNIPVCMFVHEMCVCVSECVCACAVDVWFCVAFVYFSEGGDTWHILSFIKWTCRCPNLPSPQHPANKKHLCVFGSLQTLDHLPKMTFQVDTGWVLR